MVAISLYRGNMHRVPSDVPRRWLMPTPKISLKDFRTLLHRRSKALSLLPSSSSSATATTGNASPVPSSSEPPPPEPPAAVAEEDLKADENPNLSPEQSKGGGDGSGGDGGCCVNVVDAVAIKVEDGGEDCDVKPVVVALDQVAELIGDDKAQVEEKENEKKEKDVAVENLALEGEEKLDLSDEKEKRKREVEEKLQILNEKKHNLVQALKQILNAEEELKRRSNIQAGRPPLPLQVDASNDSGSMTRHTTPRTGSEANVTVDMEGGEGDDALNHNPLSRPLLRMSSTSPSAESALRRTPYFQHNMGSHSSRAAMVAAGSPLRFAPSGNQGNPSNLLTVSVSGTNYITSSPSPAGSGGTSGFRDARQPSPWN